MTFLRPSQRERISEPCDFDAISPRVRSCDACGTHLMRSSLFTVSKASHPIINLICAPCASKLKVKTNDLPVRFTKPPFTAGLQVQANNNKSEGG